MNKLRNNEIKMLFSLFLSHHTSLRGVPRVSLCYLFRKIYIHISETLRRSAHKEVNEPDAMRLVSARHVRTLRESCVVIR